MNLQKQTSPSDSKSPSPSGKDNGKAAQAAQATPSMSATENPVPSSGAVTAYPSDYQLAGLIEAAAAAGQDIAWHQQPEPPVTGSSQQMQALHGNDQTDKLESSVPVDGAIASQSSNTPVQGQPFGQPDGLYESTALVAAATLQKQAGQQQESAAASSPTTTRKRKRTTTVAESNGVISDQNIDPAIVASAPQSTPYNGITTTPGGTENPPFSILEADPNYRPLTPPRPLHDFRAAGIHSAAALFRKPTNKKHTRPPMANMYTSLELSPENFLHLQAAAKSYMLDQDHPERRDCVGQRGKGDNEIVKLRLYNCVREFLGPMGNGEKYFGEHVVDPEVEHRSLYWPRDEQRIIALMMPLLRRMVTNERQRQYAIESRKSGAEKKRKEKLRQEGQSQQSFSSSPNPTHVSQQSPPRTNAIEPELLDLMSGGSPSDWSSISQVYDAYNNDNQLDNLAVISGLPKTDWWGLVAVSESHYHFVHQYDPNQCFPECEQYLIDRIVSSATFSNVEWKGVELKKYIITSLVRDVLQVMRATLLHGQVLQQDVAQLATGQGPEVTAHAAEPKGSQLHPGLAGVVVQINLVSKRDNKRLCPPISVSQPDLSRLGELLDKARTQLDALPQGSVPEQFGPSARLTFPVKVWMPDGLLSVHDEEEWQIALMTLSDTEWMDKQIKVLVAVSGTD